MNFATPLKFALPFLLAIGTAAAIEKPDYNVLEKSKKLELRQYADIPVASALMGGMENQDGSFMKLFKYIQGNNASEQKIKMTAPVFMETTHKNIGKSKSGRMSFMIPSKVAASGVPAPGSGEIRLGKISGGKVAVIRFSGHKSESKRAEAVANLQTWVKSKGWKTSGKPFFAYYNPPWTPEILRRNEVWIRIAK